MLRLVSKAAICRPASPPRSLMWSPSNTWGRRAGGTAFASLPRDASALPQRSSPCANARQTAQGSFRARHQARSVQSSAWVPKAPCGSRTRTQGMGATGNPVLYQTADELQDAGAYGALKLTFDARLLPEVRAHGEDDLYRPGHHEGPSRPGGEDRRSSARSLRAPRATPPHRALIWHPGPPPGREPRPPGRSRRSPPAT